MSIKILDIYKTFVSIHCQETTDVEIELCENHGVGHIVLIYQSRGGGGGDNAFELLSQAKKSGENCSKLQVSTTVSIPIILFFEWSQLDIEYGDGRIKSDKISYNTFYFNLDNFERICKIRIWYMYL